MEQEFQASRHSVPAAQSAPSANGLSAARSAPRANDNHQGAASSVPQHGTAAVDRGAELLVRVLESDKPVALAELASASGIPKSTASRLVSALERRGLIEQDGLRGPLRPGPAILRVAERSMLERSVVELARPSLDVLAEASGETINLAVAGRHGVEHLVQVDSRHFLGTGQWLGKTVDYHCTAVGKVFIAFGRAAMSSQPLNRHAPDTITDPERLHAELEAVRRHHYATAVDELEPGLAAMAAPVHGTHGEVVAALSITGPTVRMTAQRIAELKPILIEEARNLSHRLGHREEGENAA